MIGSELNPCPYCKCKSETAVVSVNNNATEVKIKCLKCNGVITVCDSKGLRTWVNELQRSEIFK